MSDVENTNRGDVNKHARRPGREGLLDDLEAVAEELGHPPLSSEYSEHGVHVHTSFRTYFDSWDDALRAAGLDPEEKPNSWKIPREDLLADLRAGADFLGRPPHPQEVDAFGEYTAETYRRRFGSWEEALAAAGLTDDPHDSEEEYLTGDAE